MKETIRMAIDTKFLATLFAVVMDMRVVIAATCETCDSLRTQLEAARAEASNLRTRLLEREATLDTITLQLRETLKVMDLLEADLKRYRADAERTQPHTPERVCVDQLQLAFRAVLGAQPELAKAVANDTALSPQDTAATVGAHAAKEKTQKKTSKHGRRGAIDLSKLPNERIVIDPPEVLSTDGAGYVCIGEETSHRLAFRRAMFLDLVIVRRKWAPIESPEITDPSVDAPSVLIAPVPDNVLPRIMADPSVIAHVSVSKYGDYLPLNRQERISLRHGFECPRSTQCDWLIAGHELAYRIVDAMFAEARATALYIATDATGAPVRAPGKCERWHHFVFVAGRDHVIFRYGRHHDSDTVAQMLAGYRGYVLADAAVIYDTLYNDLGMKEVCCWVHARRYLWRALESDRPRALEGLSLIAKIFQADRLCRDVPMPERTALRAERAGPYVDALERWIDENRSHVDPRGPLDQAFGYMTRQRLALRRFLEHGVLPLHNNDSERELRAAVLGRANWVAYENETGLKLYSTYRSLIASCTLHKLNPERYIEQMLRLIPHWPVTRVIELAPKYWKQTVANLNHEQHRILTAPWELDPASLAVTTTRLRRTATSSAA
jgi:transposase